MHHAYLWRSDESFNRSSWSGYINNAATLTRLDFATVGINEVRQLTREVILTPLSNEYERLIIIETKSLTHEAQQAMLKIFEDPRRGVVLVLSLPAGYQLLATLKSRFFELTHEANDVVDQAFLDFLRLTYKDRLELISEQMTKKDQVWLQSIKRGLLNWLRTSNATVPLATYQLVVSQLGERGASNKMLLEELALTLSLSKK